MTMKQLYHFCITCHEEVLFRDDEDIRNITNILALEAFGCQVELWADAIMSTHIHGIAFGEADAVIRFCRTLKMRITKYHRYREAGEEANVNNVEKFGEPSRSLFTSTKILNFHHEIEITDENENIVYRSYSKFLSFHDKTDVTDASGKEVAHIERKFFTIRERHFVTMADAALSL